MPPARRLLVLSAAALVGCGGPAPVPAPAPEPLAEPTPTRETLRRPATPPGAIARSVVLFYGTDRAPDGREALRFGTSPGELAVGTARVSVPLDRVARPTGTLPDLPSTLGVRRAPVPARDIFVERVQPMGEVYWDDAVRQELRYDSTRTVVVFVHGFATPWEQALRRAAQLAVDLPFDGAMAVYSWPSLGEVGPLAYFRDDKTIAASQPMLRAFLERVVERTGAERVSIVAHSMGTLLVARTLKELHDTRPELRFDQVVLGAPDIDTTSFRRSLAPALRGIARRVTIYASQHDRALAVAQKASSYPRVGQAGPGLLVLPGLDVIDASAAEEGEFGHGYLGASNAVLADLRAVLAGVPVAARRLERRQRAGLAYWELLGEAR
ncbi:MAG TPA: alpha/beta hydrolase [Gemmatimonadales bacterium]|nr:alpha/beta hydrolase [Gemmatimonadales bacterium]